MFETMEKLCILMCHIHDWLVEFPVRHGRYFFKKKHVRWDEVKGDPKEAKTNVFCLCGYHSPIYNHYRSALKMVTVTESSESKECSLCFGS